MLALFPSLLSYERLAPLLLRVILGAVFLFWAYSTLRSQTDKKNKIVAILEGIAGVLLVIGLWTQAAAIYAALDLLVRTIGKVQARSFLTDGVNYYLVLFVISIALIVLRAGFLSFDYPL